MHFLNSKITVEITVVSTNNGKPSKIRDYFRFGSF